MIARMPWTMPALLSFVAGYVDTVGFVALFNLFIAHVTGNFVLIGASLGQAAGGHGDAGLLAKLLALPVFVLGVALTTLALRKLSRGRNLARWALLAQSVLIALFMASGIAAEPFADSRAPWVLLTGMIGVAAMSVQNAASRLVFADMAASTVMTGNVTQLVIDTVDLTLRPPPSAAAASRQRIGRLLPAVLAFTAGAMLGGLGYHFFGFACLGLVLAALVGAVLACSPHKEAVPGA